jgi:hypothetical protein
MWIWGVSGGGSGVYGWFGSSILVAIAALRAPLVLRTGEGSAGAAVDLKGAMDVY